jgi:HD-GYP domain-containing protein (c-di-GMP phosphodiesterase class II)
LTVSDIAAKEHGEDTMYQTKRLDSLNEIAHTISSGFDLQKTLNTLLDHIAAQPYVDAVAVLLNSCSQHLEFALGRGFRSNAIERSRVSLGEGIAGRAALERKPYTISDLTDMNGTFKRKSLFSSEDFKSYYVTPLASNGTVLGVMEIFCRKPCDPDPESLEFLETAAELATIAIYNGELFNNLSRTKIELEVAYGATLEGWVRALYMRDAETEGHTQRVTEMTLRLATAMGVSNDKLVHITRGALLHDIGKLAIPDSILRKPGPLNEEEWAIMHQHPTYAYQLLSPISYLKPALEIPLYHHEKWDGSGYPHKLKGANIPLVARVFAIVDVWDALRSDRPYREAWEDDKVMEYLQSETGKHFDPRVVETFFSLFH